ncbi:MAG: enolase C-terminal domain-like protein [Armatimonadota bacterium]|nr:enolase C-terminal domain-like protein [Armatimonadota bacterium]MDR7421185.1 enolase C-terminal domain-like protein [Armatimonadota bacterium]
MRITRVHAWHVRMRRRVRLTTSYGATAESVTVVAALDTDQGLTGFGQTTSAAPWYGESAEAIMAQIERYLGPAILGRSPLDIEALVPVLDRGLPGALYAKSAIEFALWDLKGKALGVPVYQLLGGRAQEGLHLHGFVHHGTVDEMVAMTHQQIREGWVILKMKIGMNPAEDAARFAAVREAAGGRAAFQLDGNTGYSLGDALPALRAMERLGGVAVFEQPVRSLDGMVRLAQALETPLMADELLNTPEDAFQIARRRAAHVFHMKLHKFGGLLRAKRIAAVAEAAGIVLSVAPYTDIELAAAAHFAASTPNATWPAGFTPMHDSILSDPLEVIGQQVRPPERAGLGVEVDLARVRAAARQAISVTA